MKGTKQIEPNTNIMHNHSNMTLSPDSAVLNVSQTTTKSHLQLRKSQVVLHFRQRFVVFKYKHIDKVKSSGMRHTAL